MTFDIKRTLIRSVVMLLATAFFVLGVEIYQRPDGEGLATELSYLEHYTNGEYVNEIPSVYNELYTLGAESVTVCSVSGTAKEFAIATFADEAPQEAVSVYKKRIAELDAEFWDNAEERKLITGANIVLINQYAVFAVYDTENTARNTIFQYFGQMV